MQRVDGTRTQQVLVICGILLNIAVSFPLAMSGKTVGRLLWVIAAVLALLFGITRLKLLGKPVMVFTVLFACSFLIPVEIVATKGPLGINWMRCEVRGLMHLSRKPPDEGTYVIVRGCVPIIGFEPSHVVRIRIPGLVPSLEDFLQGGV